MKGYGENMSFNVNSNEQMISAARDITSCVDASGATELPSVSG